MKIFILLFLSAVTFYVSAEVSPQEKLIGVWGNSDDAGKTFWGFDEFSLDGSIKAWGQFPEDDKPFELEGRYLLHSSEPQVVCYAITKSSIPDIVPVGDNWCNQVVKISDTEFEYVDPYGHQETLYKQD